MSHTLSDAIGTTLANDEGESVFAARYELKSVLRVGTPGVLVEAFDDEQQRFVALELIEVASDDPEDELLTEAEALPCPEHPRVGAAIERTLVGQLRLHDTNRRCLGLVVELLGGQGDDAASYPRDSVSSDTAFAKTLSATPVPLAGADARVSLTAQLPDTSLSASPVVDPRISVTQQLPEPTPSKPPPGSLPFSQPVRTKKRSRGPWVALLGLLLVGGLAGIAWGARNMLMSGPSGVEPPSPHPVRANPSPSEEHVQPPPTFANAEPEPRAQLEPWEPSCPLTRAQCPPAIGTLEATEDQPYECLAGFRHLDAREVNLGDLVLEYAHCGPNGGRVYKAMLSAPREDGTMIGRVKVERNGETLTSRPTTFQVGGSGDTYALSGRVIFDKEYTRPVQGMVLAEKTFQLLLLLDTRGQVIGGEWRNLWTDSARRTPKRGPIATRPHG